MQTVTELVRAGPRGTHPASTLPRGADGRTLAWHVDTDPRVYLSEMGRAQRLSVEDEAALASRIINERCEESLERLVWANLGLVIDVARKYNGRGLPLATLIDHGNAGLLRAAAGFDPSKDGLFSTYAGWFIKASIKQAMAPNGALARSPRDSRVQTS